MKMPIGWLGVAFIVVLALVVLYGGVSACGGKQWQASTRELQARLESGRSPSAQQIVDFDELEGLPAPVRRYLRTVLRDGQPVVTAVHVRHRGTLNLSDTSDTSAQWKPFTSEQWVVNRPPGFLWAGRVSVLPGLPARVHDAYLEGEGRLRVALLGLISVADLRGEGQLAEGELMRFLAEAAWYPTALLPSQGVSWEANDDRSAFATLADGGHEITLLFRFDDRGLIESVRAEERGRAVGGEMVPTPWQGHFWNYEEQEGMLVPQEGEVAWLLPEGEKPYWRGQITEVDYRFAQ